MQTGQNRRRTKMLVPIAAVFLLLTALVANRQRRRSHLPAQAVIVSPRRSTVIAQDGAVRSVQSAELTMATAEAERLLCPRSVENLARTYWRFLSRVTLGLIRVYYGEHERRVSLLIKPLTLLRFDAPDYVLEPGHGNVRWQIKDGLLVARSGRGSGFLAIDVRRLEGGQPERARLRIEVEVANFYPSIAVGFSMPAYEATQSVIHVLVTHAFLRSLARLDLAKSKVGRFAAWRPETSNPLRTPDAEAARAGRLSRIGRR
jgi:hypothetical protein